MIDSLYSGKKHSDDGAHILITTVALMRNLCMKDKGSKKPKICLEKISLLVVDEADKVMKSDMSSTFLPQLVVKMAPKEMRLILTTATSTIISKNFVEKIQEKKRVVSLEMPPENLTLKNVQQLFISCSQDERLHNLD